jgi:hypothetical protein
MKPPPERLSKRPGRRSPPLRFDQRRVQRAVQVAALQTSKRTGMTQRRFHSSATCQTSRASIRACFPPRPTRHCRSSLPFAALRAQAMWIEAHGLSLVQGALGASESLGRSAYARHRTVTLHPRVLLMPLTVMPRRSGGGNRPSGPCTMGLVNTAQADGSQDVAGAGDEHLRKTA